MLEKISVLLVELENGEDVYYDALAIFSNQTSNKKLLGHLFVRENNTNRQKLIYELKEVLYQHKSQPEFRATAETGTQTQSEIIPENVFSGNLPNIPIHLSDDKNNLSIIIAEKRKQLYRLRGHLHGRLHQVTTDSERKSIAQQLLNIRSQIDAIHQEIEAVKNGQLPGSETKKELSAEQYVQLRNIRQYIARHKKNLDKAVSLSDRDKYQKLIDKYQQQLNELTETNNS